MTLQPFQWAQTGDMGLIATRTHGGATRFFAYQLGRPRAMTNGLGTLTGTHHYFPYGKEYSPGQDDEQQYKFTGHQRDTHGLSDYMRGRTCAYPLQRFMSVDPGRDGWNLYAYVGGNPIKYLDPTGNERAQIQLDQDTSAFLAGEISESRFRENVTARGSAALAGASLFVPGPEDILFIAGGVRQLAGRLVGAAKGLLSKSTKAADVVGDTVQEGVSKSAAEMAKEVASLAGRNRVSARTSGNQKVDIDLQGKPHFDKPSGQMVDTPHVHEARINSGPSGQRSLSDRTTRPATRDDVRLARRLIEREQ